MALILVIACVWVLSTAFRSGQQRARERRRLAELERIRQEQRREQERQAAQLARQEERLAQLQQQLALAQREIDHVQPIVDELKQQAHELTYKIAYFENRGLPCGGLKTELAKVNDRLYRTETRLIKAEFNKQNAQHKLTA